MIAGKYRVAWLTFGAFIDEIAFETDHDERIPLFLTEPETLYSALLKCVQGLSYDLDK